MKSDPFLGRTPVEKRTRTILLAGVIVVAICGLSARVMADPTGGWDSTTVISIPADSIAVVSTPSDSTTVVSTPVDSTAVDSPSVSEMPPLPAGSLPTRADSIAFQSVTRRVKPHAPARVLSPRDTVLVHGRDMSLQGVSRFGHPESTLAWGDVTKVERRGSAAGQGAMVGAIVFGALGMIAGATEAGDNSSHSSGADVVAGTVGSAAVGALLGAVVGAPFKRWKNVDMDSPEGGGFFNDSRRGFTLELGVGPGFANESNAFSESDEGTDFGGFTRIRLGYGLSERYTLAYVGDVAWHGDVTGIDGLGLSLFSAPAAPSWIIELTGGVASTGEIDGDDSKSHFGIQAGLGFEFSRHWMVRASLLHTSFGDENHTVVGTTIGKMWY